MTTKTQKPTNNVNLVSEQTNLTTMNYTLLQNDTENQEHIDNILERPSIDLERIENQKKRDQKYSLFQNPRIPIIFRYGVPIVIILNISLLIDANISPGATVGVVIDAGPFQSETIKVKEFTLIQSVSDMWKAGVYPLSCFIAVFSGFWPYAKLVMMFICWMVKESALSFKAREKMLIVLDAAGKWSLVDSFVMVLMIVSFRYELDLKLIGMDEALNVIVTPNWGYYGFFLQAVVSLIITHTVLHKHRSLRSYKVHEKETTNALGSENKIAYRVVIGLMLFSFTLIVVGMIINSFAFQFQGLAGFILPKDQNRTNYSVLSLGYNLPYDMPDPNSFGSRYIQVSFFLITVSFPLIFLIFLFILYTVPIKVQYQQKLFDYTEIIYAWSCIDVFMLSILASLLEISQFVSFMLGSNCDGINQILKYINNNVNNNIKIDPPVCFGVKIQLDAGCIILFISAVVFFGLGSITLRQIKHRLDKKIKQIITEQDIDWRRKSSIHHQNGSKMYAKNNQYGKQFSQQES